MAYADEVLADSPYLYWKLDETSGTSAADSSGNGRHGTYANTPTLGASSVTTGLGTSVTFAAASFERADWTTTAAYTGSWTVEAWVKPTGAAGVYRHWIGARNANSSGNYGISVGGFGDGQQDVNVPNSGFTGWAALATMTGGLPLGVWHHVVFTWSLVTNVLKIYRNGAQVGSDVVVALAGLWNSGKVFSVGRTGALGTTDPQHFYDGGLDEVAVYHSVLSSTRVLAHYTVGKAQYVDNVPSLTFTALAPDVTAVTLVDIDNAPTLAFEALAPTVTAEANPTVTVDNVPAITFTPFDVILEGGVLVEVGNVPELSFTALAPDVTATTGHVTVTVDNTPSLTFEAFAPTVTVDATVTVDNVPEIIFTALAPSFVGQDVAVTYRAAVLADDPILYHRFEDIAGTSAVDSTAHALHGTYDGGPVLATTVGATGGYGLVFDGVNDSLTLNGAFTTYSAGGGLSVPYSMEFWFKPAASLTPLFSSILHSSSSKRALRVRASTTEVLVETQNSTGGTGNSVAVTLTLNSSTWAHLVVVVDTTTLKVYVNGVLAGQDLTIGSGSNSTIGKPIQIGMVYPLGTPGNPYYAVTFDEFAIYKSLLSAPQVLTHYNAALTPATVTVDAPFLGTVTFAASVPTVGGGADIVVSVDNVPSVTFAGIIPNLLVNGGPYILADTAPVTWSMPVPTVEVISNILISADRAGMNFTMLTPTIFIGDIAFRFIGEDYTGFTAADADHLGLLHFGPIIHGQTRVARFRIGNTSSSRTNITAYATSVNNLAEMATFSTDGVNFDEAVVIGIEPNGVSDVIWLKLAVTTSAYVDNGTFLIQLENV